MISNLFYLHATPKVMCTKRCCSHVNGLWLSKFLKRHSPLKLEEDPNICNAEMVGRTKTRQPNLTPFRSKDDHVLHVNCIKGIISITWTIIYCAIILRWNIHQIYIIQKLWFTFSIYNLLMGKPEIPEKNRPTQPTTIMVESRILTKLLLDHYTDPNPQVVTLLDRA